MDTTTAIRMAKSTFLSTSFIIGGYSLAGSQQVVPLLFDGPPQSSTPIFKRYFFRGAPIVPPGSLLSTAAAVYLAYIVPSQRRLWLTALIASFLNSPWTLGVMLPGITRLIQISEDREVQSKSEQTLEHRQLLKKWVAQNYVRSVLFLTSGFVGLWATVMA